MRFLQKLADKYPYVEADGNRLTITIQDGTVTEKGVNGMQAMGIIHVLITIFDLLNEALPCEENSKTIHHLIHAYRWQEFRTRDRENRNVEGTENK